MIPKDSPIAKAGERTALVFLGIILLSIVLIVSGIIILIIGKKHNKNELNKIGKFLVEIGVSLLGIILVFHLAHI